MTEKLVKVKDKISGAILLECSIEEVAQAYQYAASMEKMDLDVEVITPTITKTLANSLGVSPEEQRKYEESIRQEMDDHDCISCATTYEVK